MRSFSLVVVLLAILLVPFDAHACNVPVFRYALEQWAPDLYPCVILHRGAMTEGQRQLATKLQQQAKDSSANVEVLVADLNQDTTYADVRPQNSETTYPFVALFFPPPPGDPSAAPRLAMTVPLTESGIAYLFDSPARRDIAKKLLDGDSGVWLLLESGDKEKDAAAAAMLKSEIAKAETREKDALNREDAPAIDLSKNVPLKVAFSTVNLSRSNPAEKHFVQLLLALYPELAKHTDPIVFPIFGRGRVLGAATGDELKPIAIARGCEFLIADCACEIKERNPGRDLLMAVNWDASLTGPLASEKPLPPLTSVLAGPATAPAIKASAVPVAPPSDQAVFRNTLLIVGGAAVLVAAISTILVLRRKGEGSTS